jgi:hypothetical protein
MLRGLLVGLGALSLGLLLAVGCGDGAGGAAPALVPTGEPLVRVDAAGVQVAGEVRNTAQRPYTGTLQVTLKDGAGRIVGSAVGAVNDVPAGGTMPYTAVGEAPTGAWERAEVAITAQLPR